MTIEAELRPLHSQAELGNEKFDSQGRQTQSLGPVHEIDIDGVATSIRRATYTVYQDALFQIWTGQRYATVGQAVPDGSSSSSSSSSSPGSMPPLSDDFYLINPVGITIMMKDGMFRERGPGR